jgi:hypothetical protein
MSVMIPISSAHRSDPVAGSVLTFAVVSGLTTATLIMVLTLVGSL